MKFDITSQVHELGIALYNLLENDIGHPSVWTSVDSNGDLLIDIRHQSILYFTLPYHISIDDEREKANENLNAAKARHHKNLRTVRAARSDLLERLNDSDIDECVRVLDPSGGLARLAQLRDLFEPHLHEFCYARVGPTDDQRLVDCQVKRHDQLLALTDWLKVLGKLAAYRSFTTCDAVRSGSHSRQPDQVVVVARKVSFQGKTADFTSNGKALDLVAALRGRGQIGALPDELFDEVWPNKPVQPNNLHVQKTNANKLLSDIGWGISIDDDGRWRLSRINPEINPGSTTE